MIIHFLKGGTQKRGFGNGNYFRAVKSLYRSAPNSPAARLSPIAVNNVRAIDVALRKREAAKREQRESSQM